MTVFFLKSDRSCGIMLSSPQKLPTFIYARRCHRHSEQIAVICMNQRSLVVVVKLLNDKVMLKKGGGGGRLFSRT